jgi:hypothetical protein
VEAKFKAVFAGDLAAIGFDIVKRFVTVDVRLALAEKIEIGTVQDVDDAAHIGLRDRCVEFALRNSLSPASVLACRG